MSKASKMIGASLATTGLMLAFAPHVSADELYKINEGDTLSQIAARFNSTVSELAKKNKINDPNLIIAGHSITIPDGQTIQVKPTAVDKQVNVYQVKVGDTLNKIAQQFNISVEKLRSLNHLEGDLILVGQQLRLKAEVEEQVETDKVTAETLETEKTTEKAAPVVEVAAPSIAISGSTYVVQPGDTLEAIAEAAGLSVSDLQAMNGLTSHFIYAGQVLQVAAKDETKSAPVEAETPEVKAQVAPQVSTPAVQAETEQQAQAEADHQAAVQKAEVAEQTAAQKEAEEAAAKQQAQAQAEAEKQAQAEAVAKQQAEAEKKAQQEAAAKQQAEAEKKAQQEAAAKQQAEAEKKAQQEAAAQKQQNQGNQGQHIVNTAQKYVGTPYVWGGKTPKGFDCSGFTHYVYKEATGKEIGGWTVPQENAGPQIGVNQAQAGDLYFWGAKGSTRHVALATDNQGGYIHAPQPGKTVQNSNVNYYRPDFAVSMAQYR